MDLLRISSTALWYFSAVSLLAWQGVLRCRWPFVDGAELCRRLSGRLSLRCRQSSEMMRAVRKLVCISLLGSCMLVAAGFATGFFWIALPESWSQVVVCLGYVLVMPGFVEELLFRGLLFSLPPVADQNEVMPDDAQGQPAVLPTLSSGSLGVADKREADSSAELAEEGMYKAKPDEEGAAKEVVQDRPSSVPHGRPPLWEQMLVLTIFIVYHLDWLHHQDVFKDWRFLLMACILGLCCQEALFATGSLWPGVLLHAVWVCGWLTCLGGAQLTMA